MAKRGKEQEVELTKLKPYEKNAKIHSPAQVQKIADSIQEFGFLNACLIDKDYNIIAGHGRVEAAKLLGMETVPCTFIEGLTEEQRKAYILADNKLTELGEWDFDIVFDELQGLRFDMALLTGFDVPEQEDFFQDRERWNRDRQEGNDEYNAFLDKFEKPKTTDDCYTPDNIYDVVANYVTETYGIDRAKMIRPFYPGGDYQKENYGDGGVVVDNPPFSIMAEIIDFYVDKDIKFFIFAPGLATLNYVNRKNVTAVCTYAGVTYENGASVQTSFITNLEDEDVAAMTAPELSKLLEETNKENEKALKKSLPKYEYPLEVITAAKMGYLSKYGQSLKFKRSESVFIRALDAQKEKGNTIFGGALLLAEKAAAEKAAAEKFPLSDREKEIINALNRASEE